MRATSVAALTIAAVLAGALPARATSIIISQTHFDGFAQGVGGSFEQTLSIFSWTQADTFTNVSVTAFLAGDTASYSGTAYLTTQIGPGTTAADQVAAATFATPGDFLYHNVSLFSGLTLGPNTYYLVLSAPLNTHAATSWGGTSDATATFIRASGVTGGAGYWLAIDSPPGSYPPAQFFEPSIADDLAYEVTGELAAVPEPASLLMVAAGAIGVFQRARRRART